MKQGYTDITMILDRSGSMERVRNSTISGVNEFISEQKRVPGEARITLALFDTADAGQLWSGRRSLDYVVVRDLPVRDCALLSMHEYMPRNGTPLYDAMAAGISNAGARFRMMTEAQRPEHVVFVIVTDGEENSSQEFRGEPGRLRLQEILTHQRDVYKWEFVFLGANIDSQAVGAGLGIVGTHSMDWAQTEAGTQSAYGTVSANLAQVRMGTKADMSYTAEDRDKQDKANKSG